MKSTSGSTTRRGNTDTLFHAAGEFLGVGGFKTIEADGVNDAEGALVAFDGRRAARFERGFDIFENGEPGKKREALKDNGNVGRFIANRLAVPVNLARAGGRETGQHAKQSGFAAAGSAEQRDDLAGVDASRWGQ